MPHALSRRTILRAAGAAVALPLLDAMLPTATAAPSTFKAWEKSPLQATPRIICCYVPNGVNIAEWVPTNTGTDYTLSKTLEALKDHRQDFTVLSGLGHPQSQGGHAGADTWLTAANLKSKPGADYTNSISIDQVVAKIHGQRTRFASLQLGDMSGTGAAGHSHTLSFDVNGTPLPSENSPRRLFERLFVPDTAGDRAATLKRYAERRSVLDEIAGEIGSLNKSLGKPDQKKLDEYLSSVRETEKQVERMQKWVDVPKPKIAETGLQLVSKPMDGHDRPMSYLAFITDTTRVISFEWSREAGGYGGGGENHHELSHHGGDAGMLTKLGVIDRFHLSRLGRFMGMLKATKEADGTMLDRTIIVFGSGMNSGLGGEHSPKNLPLLVAGGHKLGVKLGQHLSHDPNKYPPMSNVFLSLVQKMGVEAPTFADSTGTLTGLV
jgi:hypothetical protein